jgi:release factor glutamine methyltransferase
MASPSLKPFLERLSQTPLAEKAAFDRPAFLNQVLLQLVNHTLKNLRLKPLHRIEFETFQPELLSEPLKKPFFLQLEDLCTQCAAKKPLAYILGETDFLDQTFLITSDVLIPRPETEQLTLLAQEKLALNHTLQGPLLGLEVGVGSGVIALSLLKRFEHLHMVATDASRLALALCLRNAQALNLSNRLTLIEVEPSQVLEPLAPRWHQAFDFCISNPPYLKSPQECDPDVAQFEPPLALYDTHSPDGLTFYRKLAHFLPLFLRNQAWIFLELHPARAPDIAALFAFAHPSLVAINGPHEDKKRFLVAQIPSD